MSMNAETISLIIGIASFGAAIVFFFAARKSETHTIELLAKISNQTNTLERINDNLLGGLIHHIAKSHEKIVDTVISNKTPETESLTSNEDVPNDDIALYIMIYYYAGRSNFFAKYTRSNIPLTDDNKTTHVAADNAIEESKRDFIIVSEWINKQPPEAIRNHRLYSYYSNTKEFWESYVLSD